MRTRLGPPARAKIHLDTNEEIELVKKIDSPLKNECTLEENRLASPIQDIPIQSRLDEKEITPKRVNLLANASSHLSTSTIETVPIESNERP